MISETPELPFFASAPSDPDVLWLQDHLRACGGWVKAAELVALTRGRLDDRQLRSLAEASGGWVISGCRGYRHLSAATAEEISHAADRLVSQGTKMIDRGLAIRRRAHQLVAS